MAITLLTSKPRMFSTVLDVLLMSSIIKTEKLNFDVNDDTEFNTPKALRDHEVENYILKADSFINGFLKSAFNAPSGLRIDSWVTPPKYNITNSIDSSFLMGIELLQTSGYTSYYTIEFLSSTQFTVKSSLEGSQGSGTISSDFTSSNGVIKIGDNSWDTSTSPTTGDTYYFSVVDCYDLIHTISSMLAASMILSEKYSEQIPNANEYAQQLWDKAFGFLEKLADPENSLSLIEETISSTETTLIDYKNTMLGEDNSSYLTKNLLDY